MVLSESRKKIGAVVIAVVPFVTFAITPWASYDPINLPKLVILILIASVIVGLLLLDFRYLLDARYRKILVVSAIFKIDLLLLLFIGEGPFNQQFFGTSGRNTGFLTYLCLLILFIGVATNFGAPQTSKLLWSLLGVGGVSAIYGLIQSAGMDPFTWNNPYSPVFGFLGNPDFESSFLGICGVAAVAMLFNHSLARFARGGLLLYLAVALYVIEKTKAQQGFLVFAIGCAVIVFLSLFKSIKFKKFTIPYLFLSLVGGTFIILGSLDKGPIAHLLYKPSVTYRGDYWRAGWKMTVQHPFFGVGLDSYGDWYRASRSMVATLRRGPDTISNAAHNVLLDFSASGGFPLLIAYLLIVALSLVAAIRVIRRSPGFDAVFAGLFGGWIAYQIQSLISLNQIGLAVWGWVLSGALIGYDIHTREEYRERGTGKPSKKGQTKHKMKTEGASPAISVSIFVGLLVGLCLGLPPFLADAKFRSALSVGNPTLIQSAVTQWPIDEVRLMQGSQILKNSKLEPEALVLAKLAALRDPRSYYAWQGINTSPNATATERAAALLRMKALDPNNPKIK